MPAWLRATLAWAALAAPASAQQLLSHAEGITGLEQFGAAIARIADIDLDGLDDLAVGSPAANSSQGQVVLISSATGARLLTVPGTIPLGRLGASIVTISDLTLDGRPDLAVGVPGSGGANAGAVRFLDGVTLATIASIPGPSPGSRFGERLVRLDDVTGDGVPDLAASAPSSNSSAGAVLVLDVANGTVVRTLVGAVAFDAYGSGLGAVPDLSGDALADLVIGAPGADPAGQIGAGLVEVVDPVTGVVARSLFGLAAGDALGFACDGVPDIDGDGSPEILCGAPGADVGGMQNAGSCFVFNGASGTLLSKIDGLAASDAIGSTVAGLGDLEADGRGDYACGSPTADVIGIVDAGRIMVVSGGFGLLYEFTGDAAGDGVGGACVGVGDIDGDGRADFVLGAPDHSAPAGNDAGRVELRRGLAAALSIDTTGQYGTPFSLEIQAPPTVQTFLLVDVAAGLVPSPFGDFCIGLTPVFLLRTVGPIPSSGFHNASGTLPPAGPPNTTIYAQVVTSNPFSGPLFWTGGCASLTLF